MKTIFFVAALAVLSFALDAEAAGCNSAPPPKPSFDIRLASSELDKKTDEINAWWTEGRGDMPLSDALVERQERIDRLYVDFEAERRALYAGLSCEVSSTKKCASTPGKKRHCPMSVEPPGKGTRFDASKLKPIDDDFSHAPHLSGTAIAYTVKKTGNGSNTAGFVAPLVYTEGAIQGFVEDDLRTVKDYVQAKVSLQAPNGVIVGHGGAGQQNSGSSCANLAANLASLVSLRSGGALTQKQYDAAVEKVTNSCT